jgi:hypothetical protein
MIAQCANSTCRTRFDYHIGGKFFRFHLIETEVSVFPDARHNLHNVVQYWLCPICSKMFTLIHVGSGKLVLRLVSQEFEVTAPQHRLTAA